MKRRKQRKQVTMTVESSVEKKKLNEVLLSRKGGKMKDKRNKHLKNEFFE